MRKPETRVAVLLYQSGIANVFWGHPSEPENLKRLLQADFRTCEAFAAGMMAAGCVVIVRSCNMAGDALLGVNTWIPGKNATPFRNEAHPPVGAIGADADTVTR